MKLKIGRRDFMALIVAVAVVVLCSLFMEIPEGSVAHESFTNSTRAYISLTNDANLTESGISAGFLLPTSENFFPKVKIPELEYDASALDIEGISLFGNCAKAQILNKIDISPYILSENVLDSLILSEIHDFSKNSLTVDSGSGVVHDLITGQSFVARFDDKRPCSAILYKSGVMTFVVPSDFDRHFTAQGIGESIKDVKFLKIERLKHNFGLEESVNEK